MLTDNTRSARWWLLVGCNRLEMVVLDSTHPVGGGLDLDLLDRPGNLHTETACTKG
jgi:hypothetical protein